MKEETEEILGVAHRSHFIKDDRLFHKEPQYKIDTLKDLKLLLTKSPRNFPILNIFTSASNGESGEGMLLLDGHCTFTLIKVVPSHRCFGFAF